MSSRSCAVLVVGAFVLSACGESEPIAATAAPATDGIVGVERLLGGPAYEPTLAITPQGNLFYTSGTPQNDATAYPGSGWVLASYDNGASWINSTRALVSPDPPMYDNFITSDPASGRVMRATLQPTSVGGNGCLQVIWSDDQGATWTENAKECAVLPQFHDHENIAFGPPRGAPSDFPSATYLCVNHPEGTSCASSSDGGLSFGLAIPVFPSANPIDATGAYCGGLNSAPKVDHEGRVFVPRLWCDHPEVASSEDGGLTWTMHTLPGPSASRSPLLGLGPTANVEPRYIDLNVMPLAIDAADNLHVAYVAGDGLPYYLFSTDHGVTWSQARLISAPGVTAVAPSLLAINAGASGNVAFAYLATDHADGLATSDWTGARWDMKLGVITAALSGGTIAWTQLNPIDDPMGMNDCGINRCTADEPDELLPGMYDYIDLQIAPDGRPWVSMVDVCQETCRVTGTNDEAVAAVGTLAAGPDLLHPGAQLPPLHW